MDKFYDPWTGEFEVDESNKLAEKTDKNGSISERWETQLLEDAIKEIKELYDPNRTVIIPKDPKEWQAKHKEAAKLLRKWLAEKEDDSGYDELKVEYDNLCKFTTDYEEQVVALKERLEGYQAMKCVQCGDELYPLATVKKIDELKAELDVWEQSFEDREDSKNQELKLDIENRDHWIEQLRGEDTIFYNHGKNPIFIAHEIIPHPSGLSARMSDSKTIIMPGDGIDITIINLKRSKPDGK